MTERLFRAAYVLCGSSAEAEDLVREALARTHPDGNPARLMRALRRTWTDRAGAAAATAGSIDWVVDEGGDRDVPVRDVWLAYGAIQDLPQPLREALAAVDVLGLAHRDAARALRIRRRTLTSRLYRAREQVAAALEEPG